MNGGINDIKFVIIMCLTLGLAPFYPAPHIIGKVEWLLGGGVGMKGMDIFDLLLHGIPWLLLIRLLVLKAFGLVKTKKDA